MGLIRPLAALEGLPILGKLRRARSDGDGLSVSARPRAKKRLVAGSGIVFGTLVGLIIWAAIIWLLI